MFLRVACQLVNSQLVYSQIVYWSNRLLHIFVSSYDLVYAMINWPWLWLINLHPGQGFSAGEQMHPSGGSGGLAPWLGRT